MTRLSTREIGYLLTITALAGALAFSTIDAGREHTKNRENQLGRAAQSAAGLSNFTIPLAIEIVDPQARTVTYRVYSKKLGSEQRFRATVREQAIVALYSARRDSDGTIEGFDVDAGRSLEDVPPGTNAIASFSLSPDDELLIERLVYGPDVLAP
jgi:hypothetical protein